VGQSGSTSYSSDGTFTISGSGSDIWDTADAFQYAYQMWSGDGAIIARVTGMQDTDGYAKAGLMFRETLAPNAANVMVFMAPSFGADFQNRPAAGAASSFVQGIATPTPYWLKLERRGSAFNGYGSADGAHWTLVGSVTIPMGQTVYIGLAVTAHNNTLLNTATFDHVQVPQPRLPAPVLGPRPLPVRRVSSLGPWHLQNLLLGFKGYPA
jgi:hypothetical protein